MPDSTHDPVDHVRTTRPRVGESIKSYRFLPGYLLTALAVLGVAVALGALAAGDATWAGWVAAATVAAAIAAGILIYGERRRVAKLAADDPTLDVDD